MQEFANFYILKSNFLNPGIFGQTLNSKRVSYWKEKGGERWSKPMILEE